MSSTPRFLDLLDKKTDQFESSIKKSDYTVKNQKSYAKDKSDNLIKDKSSSLAKAESSNVPKGKAKNLMKGAARAAGSSSVRTIVNSTKKDEDDQELNGTLKNINRYSGKVHYRRAKNHKHHLSESHNKLGIKSKHSVEDFGSTVKNNSGKDYASQVINHDKTTKGITAKSKSKLARITRRNSKLGIKDVNSKVSLKTMSNLSNSPKLSNKLGIKAVGNKAATKSTGNFLSISSTSSIPAKQAQKTVASTAGTLAKRVVVSLATKAIASVKSIGGVIVAKFAALMGVVFLFFILLMGIITMLVGVAGGGGQISGSGFIPIEEEVLVTQMHIQITVHDLNFRAQTGLRIRTESKDVIALVFMLGVVDPERSSDDGIFEAVRLIHNDIHRGGFRNLSHLLESNPTQFGGLTVDEFREFRRFAFVEFYGTIGDPYASSNWQAFISSHFGYRADPFGGGRRFHSGIDVAKSGGTPILATISGRVQFTGYHAGGYGNWVMIVCDESGKETRYAHLSRISVSTGQRISRGSVVGLTGTTGNSTGDHLHHEFRRNGNRLNPFFYFPSTDDEVLNFLNNFDGSE